jgi:FixJ family two-component response regulator
MQIGALMSEIFIVDDDPSVRSALAVVLTGEGHQVTSFIEGEAFLSVARSRTPGCVLIDLHLPGCSGLDVLRKLDAHCYPAPILVISGHGDVPTVVDAIRNGALDFIEKPFDPAAVATRVREAIEAWQNVNREDSIFGRDFPGHDRLTARERDVLEWIARGASNKEAGRELGISPRTIEVHRARIMEKLAAKNAADLMRIVLRGGRAGSERLSDHAI